MAKRAASFHPKQAIMRRLCLVFALATADTSLNTAKAGTDEA